MCIHLDGDSHAAAAVGIKISDCIGVFTVCCDMKALYSDVMCWYSLYMSLEVNAGLF